MNLITFEDKTTLNENPQIANTNKITADDINSIKNAINNLIFPIGSIIYNASDDFDPNVVYGGTWEKIKGKMIIGFDESDKDFNTLAKIGGSKSHIQTIDEMPKHTHDIDKGSTPGGDGSGLTYSGTTVTNNAGVGQAGGSQPMDIMNPYFVANIWHRIL